eukprot:scaffold5552_cov93-Isochrysis_galbana.AAC.3
MVPLHRPAAAARSRPRWHLSPHRRPAGRSAAAPARRAQTIGPARAPTSARRRPAVFHRGGRARVCPHTARAPRVAPAPSTEQEDRPVTRRAGARPPRAQALRAVAARKRLPGGKQTAAGNRAALLGGASATAPSGGGRRGTMSERDGASAGRGLGAQPCPAWDADHDRQALRAGVRIGVRIGRAAGHQAPQWRSAVPGTLGHFGARERRHGEREGEGLSGGYSAEIGRLQLRCHAGRLPCQAGRDVLQNVQLRSRRGVGRGGTARGASIGGSGGGSGGGGGGGVGGEDVLV